MKKSIILSLLFIIAIVVSPAMGIGIQKAEFYDVEQGTSETINIQFYTGNEPENNFTLELIPSTTNGWDKSWLTITPANFKLGASKSQTISITVTVPKDATLGDRIGDIKYVGSRVMGTGQIGYTVATKSVMHFNVVKEGAKKEVTFLSIDANPNLQLNIPAKITTTVKNTGNIPTTFHIELHVKDSDYVEIYSTRDGGSSGMPLPVGESQLSSLYWEPKNTGEYTGYLTVVYDDNAVNNIKGTEVVSNAFKLTVGGVAPTAAPPESTGIPPMYIVYGIGAIIVVLLLVLVLRRSQPDQSPPQDSEVPPEEPEVPPTGTESPPK